ncbi:MULTISPECIES: DoxX family protein [Mumia]|uniref:DoxX family protein n=1 Tax=Mumia TaxID=1546255 RepID=UPI00141E5BE0|nr:MULTISPECIES: DoxX family protein [unclassified Mumia]QMW67402.1 DoxX family protein [Mumia sp. ZJ1417]
MTLLRTAARPMLASMFVSGGVNALRNSPALAVKVKPVSDRLAALAESVAPGTRLPTDPVTLVRINAAVQVTFGTALALGRFPRLSALVLAGTLAPTTVIGHPFWKETEPEAAAGHRKQFVKNASILGGLLMATLDPDPHKKILPRRAKDKVVEASESVQESLHDTAHQVKRTLQHH